MLLKLSLALTFISRDNLQLSASRSGGFAPLRPGGEKEIFVSDVDPLVAAFRWNRKRQ
jgi:hypothetical protein